MLVLSRNRDSEVHIGTGIVVKVLSVRNRRVKLGIEAPDDVQLLRGEIAPSSVAVERAAPLLKGVLDETQR